jgi:dihydroneopterin aldolase
MMNVRKVKTMDQMRLKRMSFFGYHGVYKEEQKLGQKYMVDITLFLDLEEAGKTDDLEKTINYAEVYETIRTIVEGSPFKLIEALAESIASTLLATYTKMNECTIQVIKPNPPFSIHFDGVSVQIHRKRA